MIVKKPMKAAAALLCAPILLAAAGRASAITIAAARAMPVGSVVSLTDVTISNLYDTTFSGSVRSIHVQDATGGITVVDSQATLNALLAGLSEGDEINIDGPTGAFNGLLQLGFGVGPITPTGNSPGVPAPQLITPADLLNLSPTAESLESELVRLSSVTFTGLLPGQTFNGGTNYTVTDGINSGIVRIANDIGTPHPLQGQLIPTGPVDISGVFSQFDNTAPLPLQTAGGYQVLALSVTAIPEPGSLALLVIGMAVTALAKRRTR